ncbi:MAG: hypothetical protein R2784_09690 [Saprospiraceae bacterium]
MGYFTWNGKSWNLDEYIGLPQAIRRDFYVCPNNHLYVILNRERVFRSTHPIGYPNLITGKVILDQNKNCEQEPGETGMLGWKVKVEANEFLSIKNPDINGKYTTGSPRSEEILN